MVVSPHRLVVQDARGQGGSFHITRHPEQQKVVISQWRDGACVATTPVDLNEVPAIIAALADALGDALALPRPEPIRLGFWSQLQQRLRPAMAKVVQFPRTINSSEHSPPDLSAWGTAYLCAPPWQ